jgi:DNA repair protein RecO (recombination protein O)
MLHKTKGIILHTLKYGDTSLIAHIYTRDFGRQSYLIKGVRSKSSKMQAAYFQPLTILELQVDHKTNREIQRIHDIKELHPFFHIRTDIVKSTIALFIGEILYRSLKEAEGNHQLFDYIENSIMLLDVSENGFVNFHLIFLLQFTRFLGIFPENNTELDQYQPENVSISLMDLLTYSLQDMDKLKLKNSERNQLILAVIEYYYYHLEGMGKISSLEILHEVFS